MANAPEASQAGLYSPTNQNICEPSAWNLFLAAKIGVKNSACSVNGTLHKQYYSSRSRQTTVSKSRGHSCVTTIQFNKTQLH